MISDLALFLVGAVLVNNFVLVQFLGLCPFMGVSTKLESALGMAMATTFVLTLTFSRWFFLRFFLDQSLENFLRGHVYAFADLQGTSRYCLYDNLRSAVLDRYGEERMALAAYHAGQGNVDSWRKQGVGIQFPETRSYVAKVARVKAIIRPRRAR